MKLPDLDELRPAGGLGHHIIGTSVSYHAEDILGFEKVLLRNNSQIHAPYDLSGLSRLDAYHITAT